MAQSFQVTQATAVTGIEFGLYFYDNTQIRITADQGGKPGAVLATYSTFLGTAGRAGLNLGTDKRGWGFMSTAPAQLAPGVTYWIVASKVVVPGADTNGNLKITNENYADGVALKSSDGITWSQFSHPCGSPSDIPFALF